MASVERASRATVEATLPSCGSRAPRSPEKRKTKTVCSAGKPWGPFLESPGNLSGPVSGPLKCPYRNFFLFSYLNLNITLRTSVKKFFDLHKTQIFYEFYKTFKFAAILAHHSH